jgi:predicted NBD/HSP70 family sugar kinase
VAGLPATFLRPRWLLSGVRKNLGAIMANYVCMDIGGMSIKHGVASGDGVLLTSGATPLLMSEVDMQTFLDKLAEIILHYKKDYKLSGVAIATAGMVDTAKGTIIYSGAHFPKNYTGTNLKKFVEDKCKLTCTVENDVNAAALGEYWLGSAQEKSLIFCITVGTGIGGALLYKGKLIHGAAQCTGEVGYTFMGEKNRWEDVASTAALVKQVTLDKGASKGKINGEKIFELAREEDPTAINALQELIERLSIGIANICYTINPELVVLGGGITAQKEYLEPRLNKRLAELLIEPIRKNTKLVFATLGNKAGMLGALYFFLQEQTRIRELKGKIARL